jgi:hypothetical protein
MPACLTLIEQWFMVCLHSLDSDYMYTTFKPSNTNRAYGTQPASGLSFDDCAVLSPVHKRAPHLAPCHEDKEKCPTHESQRPNMIKTGYRPRPERRAQEESRKTDLHKRLYTHVTHETAASNAGTTSEA